MNRIELFDTTLRDGTQGEHVSISANDKLQIAKKLDAFGIGVIEGGWPGSNPRDQEFFEMALDHEWKNAQICAFGSTRRPSFQPEDDPNLASMLKAQTPVVSIFGKSWTLHVEVALGITREENLDLISSSVRYLKANGKRVIYDAEHFFDGFNDDESYALETLAAAADAGADVLVLCDTNGGTLPGSVQHATSTVVDTFSVPIGIHAHNDAACAAANTFVAVEAGARHVQGTINGIGERCGNVDLCSAIPGLQLKMGYDCVDPAALIRLTDLSHLVYELANLDPVDRSPFVGRSAFAHKGGIHVSAVMKDPRAYEHIEPGVIGNARRVLVSDLSGKSNVRYKAEELGIDLSDSDTAGKAVARIKELEHFGFAYEAAEASFELILRTIKGDETAFFDLERFSVRSELDGDGLDYAEATVVVSVDRERSLEVAEGAGPVDAMSLAMHKALEGFYPQLTNLRLTDYKVRVIDPESGTGAKVRVLIEHQDGFSVWNTVGVSDNIIEASWQALADGVRYYLLCVTTESDGDPVESKVSKEKTHA